LELSNIDDNGQILEIINLIYIQKYISKIIIYKAAILNTAVTIDDFKDVNKYTVDKYFKVLKYLGIIMQICDKNVKRQISCSWQIYSLNIKL